MIAIGILAAITEDNRYHRENSLEWKFIYPTIFSITWGVWLPIYAGVQIFNKIIK
ncbi:MAG: hypothetical protein ACP5N7_05525 [Candidatus Pacearchaeota archaeon]